MKSIVLVIVLFCFSIGMAASAPEIPLLPQTGKALADFIPQGWKLLKRTDGDLNQDSRTDTAAVIEYIKSDPDSGDAPPRLLFILFQLKEGYRLALQTATAIMKSDAGGVMGDPFLDLKYNNGSLLISFYGGSRERWGYLLRFRYQNDGWYLIGFTKDVLDSATGKGKTEDYNLLNGQMIITTISGARQTHVKKRRAITPLVNLKTFDAETIEEMVY